MGSDLSVLIRGLLTGKFCDGSWKGGFDKCFARNKVPADYANASGFGNQRTPLCSYSETFSMSVANSTGYVRAGAVKDRGACKVRGETVHNKHVSRLLHRTGSALTMLPRSTHFGAKFFYNILRSDTPLLNNANSSAACDVEFVAELETLLELTRFLSPPRARFLYGG